MTLTNVKQGRGAITLVDTIGDRIKAVREFRGLSQVELARQVGISPGAIGNYENNSREQPRKLSGIADALGVSLKWLEHGTGPNPVAIAAAPTPSSGLRVAQLASLHGTEDAPLVHWGALMQSEKLPARFWIELPDDAMAPRAPAGHRVLIDTAKEARPGDGVLVKDASGNVYFRVMKGGAVGRWTAHAFNPAYEPLDMSRDSLAIVGVLTAEEGRWA